MLRRRLTLAVTAAIGSICAAVVSALPAAAVTTDEKLAVLSSFTQNSVSSYNLWLAADTNQSAWSDYDFDWSTDYCSYSPDNPLGFDFTLPCARHDFGYRNYKAMSAFSANKSRLDSAFYGDMTRVCATYPSSQQSACTSVAWLYYEAVALFGSLSSVSDSDLAEVRTELSASSAT